MESFVIFRTRCINSQGIYRTVAHYNQGIQRNFLCFFFYSFSRKHRQQNSGKKPEETTGPVSLRLNIPLIFSKRSARLKLCLLTQQQSGYNIKIAFLSYLMTTVPNNARHNRHIWVAKNLSLQKSSKSSRDIATNIVFVFLLI